MKAGLLLVLFAGLAASAVVQCESGCNSAYSFAVNDCNRAFSNVTATGCDGMCHEEAVEALTECVAVARRELDTCEAACSKKLLQTEPCEFRCNLDYILSANDCNSLVLGTQYCINMARATQALCLSACGATSGPALLQDCGCDRTYQPVCGGNGVTYNNQCLAVCAQVTFFTLGECRDDSLLQENECPIPVCVGDSPVCGSDGVTYNPPCLFTYAQCLAGLDGDVLTMAHDGECRN